MAIQNGEWGRVSWFAASGVGVLCAIKTGIGKWEQTNRKIIQQDFTKWEKLYQEHPIGTNALEEYRLNMIQTANMSLGLDYDKVQTGFYNYGVADFALPRGFLIVSNGVDVYHKGLKQTKCWQHNYWEKLVRKLDIPVVQVGTKFDKRINGTIDLLEKTSVPQLMTLLKNAKGVICTEGGLMHLSYAVGQKNTIVLRGPTKGYFFSYPDQIYIDSPVCQPCYWETDDWWRICPKRVDKPCMSLIKPEIVMWYVHQFLGKDRYHASELSSHLETTGILQGSE